MGLRTSKSVTIKPTEEVPAEIIASSIVKIANAMKALSETRLTRRAIITLIQADTRIPKCDIDAVMTSLEKLEAVWLKPIKK